MVDVPYREDTCAPWLRVRSDTEQRWEWWMQVHSASVHTVKPTLLNVRFSLQDKSASATASPDASLAE